MNLEWKTNPQGDRVWANVPKGQLIISQGIRGQWVIDLALLPESMRSHALDYFCGRNFFRTMESAKRALTDFYLEQMKETEQ